MNKLASTNCLLSGQIWKIEKRVAKNGRGAKSFDQRQMFTQQLHSVPKHHHTACVEFK